MHVHVYTHTHTVIIDGFAPEPLVVTLCPYHLQYNVGVDDLSFLVPRLGQLLATDHLERGRDYNDNPSSTIHTCVAVTDSNVCIYSVSVFIIVM